MERPPLHSPPREDLTADLGGGHFSYYLRFSKPSETKRLTDLPVDGRAGVDYVFPATALGFFLPCLEPFLWKFFQKASLAFGVCELSVCSVPSQCDPAPSVSPAVAVGAAGSPGAEGTCGPPPLRLAPG